MCHTQQISPTWMLFRSGKNLLAPASQLRSRDQTRGGSDELFRTLGDRCDRRPCVTSIDVHGTRAVLGEMFRQCLRHFVAPEDALLDNAFRGASSRRVSPVGPRHSDVAARANPDPGIELAGTQAGSDSTLGHARSSAVTTDFGKSDMDRSDFNRCAPHRATEPLRLSRRESWAWP